MRGGTPLAETLLEVGGFLQQRGLLTDGGALNLARGLRGRGGVLSLTTQDVRASAHGLTRELLLEPDPGQWPLVAERYYQRYDRGKPRRPSRLQRLYQQWSADLGPAGLLRACQSHPHLWSSIAEALALPGPDDPDRRLLGLAVEVRASGDWAAWRQAYQGHPSWGPDLLGLLPLLPYPLAAERLDWLAQQQNPWPPWPEAVLLACWHREPVVLAMPDSLIRLTLSLVAGSPSGVDPRWLAVLRFYRWPATEIDRLAASLLPHDPIHRIVYGARPGHSWLGQLLEQMREQSLPGPA